MSVLASIKELKALADLIEAGDGLLLMRLRNGTTYPYQLGIKRTAMVIAALRQAAAREPE